MTPDDFIHVTLSGIVTWFLKVIDSLRKARRNDDEGLRILFDSVRKVMWEQTVNRHSRAKRVLDDYREGRWGTYYKRMRARDDHDS